MPKQRPEASALRRRVFRSAATLALLGALLVGCSPAGAMPPAAGPTTSATPVHGSPAPTEAPSPTEAPAPTQAPAPTEVQASAAAPTPSGIEQVALALPLIDESMAIPEYRRDDFGDGWVDVDRNGCSTRQDVLQRDLEGETLADDGCTVLTGTLPADPYTGATIEFAHDRVGGDSQAVQVDHIVSLSAAHRGGAWAWTADERIAFANDPETLLAVDGPTNAAKGDRGPAEWMPEDPAFWCEYAAGYTTVAARYGLAVTGEDREMLVDVLAACA